MGKFNEREKRILDDGRQLMFDQLEQTIRDVKAKNDISLEELKAMGEMWDAIKDIQTSCAMDEASSYDDYSYYMDYEDSPDKMMHRRNTQSYYDRTRVPYYDPAYTDGMIMHNRTGYSGNYRGNSRPNNMSRNGSYMSHFDGTDHSRTRVMNHLEKMLDAAETDEERKMITRWMNEA